MQKILYVVENLTNSGPSRVVENIIKNIDTKKYEVYILTLMKQNDLEIIKQLQKINVKIISLDYPRSFKKIRKNKKEIVSEIQNINPNIIHTHGIIPTFFVYNLKINSKKVTTIHNDIKKDYRYTYGILKGFIYSHFHLLMLKKFNKVVCCSKNSYDVLKKYINCSYIRNGIDISKKIKFNRNEIRKKLKIKDNDIIYIYGGVITARKRVCELVSLFNKTLKDNEYLLIVGDGKLKKEAENIANNNHIKFLEFQKNIIDYFLASDIYVSNSASEGFSISVIEALECNLLLLLSNIKSHKECFEIDNSFYLGELFNNENFKQKKDIIILKIKERRETKKFKQKYLSSKIMSENYQKIYEE